MSYQNFPYLGANWHLEQLTFGSAEGQFHAHSYYDLRVFDSPGRRILAHRMSFSGRRPTREDEIGLGLVDVDRPGSWTPLGYSRAWSWQQGPMAQWVGAGPRVVWNDREANMPGRDHFVARVVDTENGRIATLPGPVYAISPDGGSALSLNMARLNALRPGYGYAGGAGADLASACPGDDGVWCMDMATGLRRLVLPLAQAVESLRRSLPLSGRVRHRLSRYIYWFNHAKYSPNGRRFTVKLRWRKLGGPWNSSMGVSLTAAIDGTDVRLLADATSHVIWLDDTRLYFWRNGELALFRDAAPRGTRIEQVAPDLISANVHMRHLPPVASKNPRLFVLDTPYQETVDLLLYDASTGARSRVAQFKGHVPPKGEFRCDLHPCPSEDGRKIIVSSLQDGGQQIYLLRMG